MADAARTAILALHYQNEVLHPDGLIRVGLAADDPARSRVIDAAAALLSHGRGQGWPIVHVRVAFRPDYADCPTNMPIFRRVVELGAVRENAWGADFFEPLAPLASQREFVVTHTRISAFAGTSLEQILHMLDVRRLVVAGVATHSVVEGTVRDAADRGFDTWVAADACAAAQRDVHDASLASMALVATVSTVAGIAA
ncbi:MAG: cysteine hydrolase [Comamonadaceae bacterium]|nr:MAG: cysteine hydrolase [Comamonadaceae bacterium]